MIPAINSLVSGITVSAASILLQLQGIKNDAGNFFFFRGINSSNCV